MSTGWKQSQQEGSAHAPYEEAWPHERDNDVPWQDPSQDAVGQRGAEPWAPPGRRGPEPWAAGPGDAGYCPEPGSAGSGYYPGSAESGYYPEPSAGSGEAGYYSEPWVVAQDPSEPWPPGQRADAGYLAPRA